MGFRKTLKWFCAVQLLAQWPAFHPESMVILMRTRKPFTLIELLVVVAIISVLASMLLPALGRARSAARAIDCKNRLHNVILATVVYAGDYDGWSMDSTGGWYNPLSQTGYIPTDLTLVRCPIWSPSGPGDAGYTSTFSSYGIRRIIDGTNRHHPLKRADNSSDYLLFVDSISLQSSNAYYLTQRSYVYGNDGQFLQQAHCRHRRRANAAFLDGSVRDVGQKDLFGYACPKVYVEVE